MEPVCLADIEDYAKKHMPKYAFDFYAGGANEETTLKENIQAFKRLKIRPRVLRGISEVDMSTTILGEKISTPICIAPTASHKMAHELGEIAVAKAASEAGTCMVVSMMGTTLLEDVATASAGSLQWMQLYHVCSPEIMKDLVRRAEIAGYKAIVLTVDAVIRGQRLRDIRNRSQLLPHVMDIPNIAQRYVADAKKLSNYEQSEHQTNGQFAFDTFVKSLFDATISFDTVDWFKKITHLPIVVKGILTADDAIKAVKHGADGIIVSNHGGRQLDTVPATIEVLPEIVEAVQGQAEVYVDGGIRLGTDVLKALALGARAVFVGRPVIWGLAYKGKEGVSKVLELLTDEFKTAMVLSGCGTVADIKPSLLLKTSARL